MQKLILAAVFLLALASCRSSRNVSFQKVDEYRDWSAVPVEDNERKFEKINETQSELYGAFKPGSQAIATPQPAQEFTETSLATPPAAVPATEPIQEISVQSAEASSSNSHNAFEEVRQMEAQGKLNLSKKQMKRLDRLEKKMDSRFENAASSGFWTPTALIIGVAAGAALLIALITGSAVFAFLAIVGGALLLLKALDVLNF